MSYSFISFNLLIQKGDRNMGRCNNTSYFKCDDEKSAMERLQSFAHLVFIETLPNDRREIIEEEFKNLQKSNFFDVFDEFTILFFIAINNNKKYKLEISKLIFKAGIPKDIDLIDPATIATMITTDIEDNFINDDKYYKHCKDQKEIVSESSKRLAYLGLINSVKSLIVIKKMLWKEYFYELALEVFLLFCSIFQATSANLLEESLFTLKRQSDAVSPAKKDCIRIMKSFLKTDKKLTSTKFFEIIRNNYPNGIEGNECLFFYDKDSAGKESLRHIKLNDPDQQSVTIEHRSVVNYLSIARSEAGLAKKRKPKK